MMEALLKQLEELVGTDDFEFDSEDIMEQLSAEGAGSELITPLLQIMERHPLDDFGMPGAMAAFIERFHPAHMPLLAESLKRSPALHTVWMLNRCINGGHTEYLSLMQEIAENPAVDSAIRESAKGFLDHQTNRA